MTDLARWALLDREARNLAYNNNAAVPDSARLNAERIAASAAYRAAHPDHLDLAYGPAERNRWDLFPAADPSAPCLAFIHGGYWQRNRREDFASLCEGAAAMGWSAAMLGYSLAPEATLTQIVSEVRSALDWLQANSDDHGVSGPVVISGWSAGAHLAALALDHPLVSAGLAISGVYELGPIRDTWLNEALSLTESEVVELSPLRLPVVSKPLVIAFGTDELSRLVHDSRDFHALRAAAHAPGPLLPVAGADHFSILDQLKRPDGDLCAALCFFERNKFALAPK